MNSLHLLRALPLALICALSVVQPGSAQASGSMVGTIATPAAKQLNGLVGTLRQSGYRIIEIRKTFLGRLRIRAENGVHLREIVVSQSTGEIKHDAVIKVFAPAPGVAADTQESQHESSSGMATTSTASDGSSASVSTSDGSSASVPGGGTSVSGSGSSASVSVGGVSASISDSGATVSVGGTSVSASSGGVSLGD